MVQTTGANFEFPKVPDFLLPKREGAPAEPQGPVDKAELGGSAAPKPDGQDTVVRRRPSADIKNADPEFFKRKGHLETVTGPTPVPTSLAMNEMEAPPADPKPGQGVDHATVADFEARTLENLGPLAHIQDQWDITSIQGKIPTLQELQETFNECAQDKDIPWEHIIDGCYARAHLACKKFMDKDINAAKFYAVIDDNHPGWRFDIKNKFCEGNWWYHVSCLVFAKDENGKVDGYVVDPAVDPKKPMKASDWIKSYWNQEFPMKFDTTYADVYEPQEEIPSPHEPSTFSQEKFDSMVGESIKIDEEYSKALHDIKDKYYKEHPDEKPDDWK